MAYSPQKYRTLLGSALAVAAAGMALVFWLARNHTDPVAVGTLRVVVALIICGLGLRAIAYRDEVERQTVQRLWFWGSIIGMGAMTPLVVSLQTHKVWLDAAVQYIPLLHPQTPSGYFNLGVMVPVIFQGVTVLVLLLLDKLRRGPQS